MDKKYANYLLSKTKDDYNRIAVKFSNTRANLTDDIIELGQFATTKNRVLDFGCGNGRLSTLFKDKTIQYTGVDFSYKMIEIARKIHPTPNFIVIDSLKLPFADKYFDKIFCLSVLHHIPSRIFRLELLKEFKRVLKPNGMLSLTVWNLMNEPDVKALILKNSILKFLGLTKLDFGDFFRSFSDETQTVRRYVHCFSARELKQLFLDAGFNILEQKTLYRGKLKKFSNLLIVAKKYPVK
ncbi:MAG: class I SAM-dependent methyltransferase [Patescibacteria group bacterium]|nr:class I SAM-dependent methyltransferase [Patescibacteria group bacterium]